MRRPDFFIIGAPKCGTSAMYDFLAQHTDIFMPVKKEIHFFGTDLYSPNYLRDRERYLSHFAAAKDEKRVGEASVWYLYSQRASHEIKEFCPTASIIIMLRNPVEMIHSLHSHLLYIATEEIEDFAEALSAEEDRKRGLRVPAQGYPLQGLFYREVGKYTNQVKRYLDAFGDENVRTIIYDDFKSDPARACRETFAFLGVDPGFEPEIRVINANKKIRSKEVRSLLEHPPAFVRKLARPLSSELRHKVFRTFSKLNTDYVPRQPLPNGLRRQLQTYFALDVERLSDLLGRDLTHWCQP